MDRNINDQLHPSYSDNANDVWTCLNTTGQVLSLFEIASKTALKPVEVRDTLTFLASERLVEVRANETYSVLPGIVCEAGE